MDYGILKLCSGRKRFLFNWICLAAQRNYDPCNRLTTLGQRRRCLVAEGCLALMFFCMLTWFPSDGIYLLKTLQTLFWGSFLAVLLLRFHHTSGASLREAVLAACTTSLSTRERSRVARNLCHICVSDLPTALREVYLLSPTVLWLLCRCGSPCPNGP